MEGGALIMVLYNLLKRWSHNRSTTRPWWRFALSHCLLVAVCDYCYDDKFRFSFDFNRSFEVAWHSSDSESIILKVLVRHQLHCLTACASAGLLRNRSPVHASDPPGCSRRNHGSCALCSLRRWGHMCSADLCALHPTSSPHSAPHHRFTMTNDDTPKVN